MKRFLTCLLLVFVLVLPSQAFAATEDDFAEFQTYSFLESFITANPSRVAGSPGEAAAADWLAEKVESMGYDVEKQKVDLSDLGYAYDESCNVVATKPSASSGAKTVVVGAHYDSADVNGCQGVVDNGCGVAALLAVAQRLANEELPFNVEFVFFGSEELGSVGAYQFVSGLTDKEKDDILLMINLDAIANGDKLYIWGEDISNPQTNYFVEKSEGKMVAAPRNKGVVMNYPGFRPYYEIMQSSDSTEFLAAGIPVALFFSGNFDSSSFGYVENDGAEDVSHTSYDTLKAVKERYGTRFIENTEAVVDTVCSGLVDSGFESAVKDARSHIVGSFWVDPLYASLIFVAIAAVAAALAIYYHKKLKKRAALGTPDVKKTEMFTKPDDDDVFTFRS